MRPGNVFGESETREAARRLAEARSATAGWLFVFAGLLLAFGVVELIRALAK